MSCVGVCSRGDCIRGVQLSVALLVGVLGRVNLEFPLSGPGPSLEGDPVGVECRSGEGDAGDSGRRNGELRVGGEL